jgi:quercetin dioxygenase-like cupin family protein
MSHERSNETDAPIRTEPRRLDVVANARSFYKHVLVERDGLKVVRLVVPAGVEVPEHHATVDVVATVVRGMGTFTVAGESRAIGPGDVVEMAPRVRHALRAQDELELIVVHARLAGGETVHCGA